jgi:2-C-methyl-D-erythritol 2,4-cyclodiphosphate synthase
MRVGQGYDAHRFKAGTFVTLGGVEIAHEHGLAAHSDGDVLLHAICDALLGAAALGDIGRHFPDSDPTYAGISSRVLLREVTAKVRAAGYRVLNIDAVVICERPRIARHVAAMCANIAADCALDVAAVNVKGTTTETMGFTGRGEGIAASAACLIDSLI